MTKKFLLGIKQSKSVFYICYFDQHDQWSITRNIANAYQFDNVSSALHTFRYMRSKKNLFDDTGSNILIKRLIECPLVTEVSNGNAQS